MEKLDDVLKDFEERAKNAQSSYRYLYDNDKMISFTDKSFITK